RCIRATATIANRCSTPPTSGSMKRSTPAAIASSRFQLTDQLLHGPRERLQIALPDRAADRADPLLIRGPQLFDEGPAAPRERYARGAQIARILAAIGQPELLEPR